MSIALPCSEQSLAASEPIAGTATAVIHAWLLIELREPWERDVATTPLPHPIHHTLKSLSEQIDGLRTMLIRRPPGHVGQATGHGGNAVITVSAQQMITRFVSNTVESIAELPLRDALTAGQDGNRNDPLFLVCAHGHRDRCCARRGISFARALIDAQPDLDLWLCSHLGGHRFAATMVVLPRGTHYGRLTPDDAVPLLAAERSDALFRLDRYRGSTRWPRPVQAAAHLVRQQTNTLVFDDVQLVSSHQLDAQRWQVTLSSPVGQHTLQVSKNPLGCALHTSCAATEPSAPDCYQIASPANGSAA